MMVQTGACDVVLAGGVESMSNIEYGFVTLPCREREVSVPNRVNGKIHLRALNCPSAAAMPVRLGLNGFQSCHNLALGAVSATIGPVIGQMSV